MGAVFVYSDLSMITMMYVVGTIVQRNELVSVGTLRSDCMAGCAHSTGCQAQCFYEAFVQQEVVQGADMDETGFLPPTSLWPRIAPTWNDTAAGAPGHVPYRNRVIQVHVL